jgi:hypothetical protein
MKFSSREAIGTVIEFATTIMVAALLAWLSFIQLSMEGMPAVMAGSILALLSNAVGRLLRKFYLRSYHD